MMKIYTKTGDQGHSTLFDGEKVKKNHWRLDAYGTLDELNSQLAVCLSLSENSNLAMKIKVQLQQIQVHLFVLGSHLATSKKEIKEF